MTTTLFISDLHCPYHHPGAFDFLAAVKRQFKPREVVCLGDEIDAYSFSTYKHSPESDRGLEEIRKARAALKQLGKLFPKMVICESNHTYRLFKRAQDAGLPTSFVKNLSEILEAPPGWTWVRDYTLRLPDDTPIFCTHGDGFSGKNAALNAAQGYRCRTVIGHVHAYAGVQWSSGPRDVIWGMNVGCLIDTSAIAFDYAKNMATKPTLGTGVLEGDCPVFLPFPG